MEKNIIFVFLICIFSIYPLETLQQRKGSSGVYNTPNEKEYVPKSQGTHWKSIAIILMSVLVLAAICYGTNCLYICQMTLCSGPERQYTKMDLTSQV